MLASTPKPPATDARASAASGKRAIAEGNGRSSAIWWAYSVVFHTVLLGWLLFFSPVRVIDISPSHASSRVSSSRAQEVIEHVRQHQTETLSSTLAQLRTIRAQLEKLEAGKRDEFTNYARDLTAKAPQQIAAAQSALAAAQAEAVQVLQASKEHGDRFVQTRAGVEYDDLVETQKSAKEIQAKIATDQERILEILSLGADRFAQAADGESKAIAAQEAAAQAASAAEAARQPSRSSRQRTPHEKEIDRAMSDLKKAKSDLATLPEQIEKLTLDLQQAETALEHAAAAA
ncbi:MAG TPA: hypothetical protein VGJ15_11770, partial [Pirellulales bacterium]